MRLRPSLLALVWALPALALAEPLGVEGRLSLGPAWDSNATRAVSGGGPAADESLRLLGDLEARFAPTERLSVTLGYRGGLDRFRERGDQDRSAHDLTVAGTYRATRFLAPGLEGRARLRDTRDEVRDATDLSAAATLRAGPVARATATARLGYRAFDYAAAAYSFGGPFAGVTLRWQPAGRHAFTLGYELSSRAYPEGTAYRHPVPSDEAFISSREAPAPSLEPLPGRPFAGPDDVPGDPGPVPSTPEPAHPPGPSALGRRHDLAHTAGLAWTWKGPAILSGGYTFSRVDSNGYGFDTDRHRFQVLAGLRLPGEVTATSQAVLQLARFPDGIFLSDELLLVDDEENLSSLSLQLSRELWERLCAEVRYAVYVGSFAEAGIAYERHVAGAAITYRF